MTAKRRMMSVSMVIVSACVLALSLMGWAEDETQSRPQSTARASWSDQQSHQEFTPNLVNANALIGADVKNAQDERLGKIREVVLNSQRDQVSYVAVGFGGALGIGEKYLAVPWRALDVQAGKEGKVDKVVLNVPRQDFENASGFDTNNWPNQGDPRWSVNAPVRGQERARRDGTDSDRSRSQAQRDRDAWYDQDERARTSDTQQSGTDSDRSRSQAQRDRDQDEQARTSEWSGTDTDRRRSDTQAQRDRDATYGQDERATIGRGITYRKLTEIVGLPVKNRQDDDLGNIEDVVLDLQEGRPVYGLIGFGGFLGFGEKMVSIPWSAVTIRPQQTIARIDMAQDDIRNIAYEPKNAPDLTNKHRAEQLHARFGETPYWQVFGYSEPSQAQGYEAWKSESTYNKMYDASKEETVKGTLLSIGTFQPETGADGGMRLRLKTEDGKTAVICAGPREHFAKQNIIFVPGEQIEVTGSKVEIDGRTIIMAREVKRDETLTLRSKDGQPKWSDDGPDGARDESQSMDPTAYPTLEPTLYEDRR